MQLLVVYWDFTNDLYSEFVCKRVNWIPNQFNFSGSTHLPWQYINIAIFGSRAWIHDLLCSAFSKTRLLPELRRVLSCKSPAEFLHFPLEEKRPWGPFYPLWQVLAKGRHLLQILLKALLMGLNMISQVSYMHCTGCLG